MALKLLSELLSVPWKPHNYQKKAMKFLLEHACAALFLDPGLGKTSITLGAFKVLRKKGVASRALLVAPLRVCYSVWPRETQKWTDFKDIKVKILHGKNKNDLLQELLDEEDVADVYVINPEGLEWLLDVTKTKGRTGKTKVEVNLARFKKLGFDTLIIDELSKFKHTTSNRFKALKCILHTFSRRWGLTGSPAPNGLMDLFGQCFILDQGNALGQYITHYRSKYFLPSYDGFGWILQEGADQLIYKRLAPLALRMAAEDYLDMPALVTNDIFVDLPDSVRELYDHLEDDLIAKLDERTITAATAAVASVKCRQVANGGIYLEPDILKLLKKQKSDREWVNLHDAKTDVLEELIEELQGSPLLVAYDFAHDLDRLKARFGKDIPIIGGRGGKASDTGKLIDKWNAGDLPYLFAHPQSAAHGLDGLQFVGNHVCWHSLTWDYELYDQFIRRVLRQGSKSKRVFNHRIIARDTVDERIAFDSLGGKKKGQQALFEALKKLGRGRK